MSASLQLAEYTGHLITSSILIHEHDKPKERRTGLYAFLGPGRYRMQRGASTSRCCRCTSPTEKGRRGRCSATPDRFQGRSSLKSNIRMSDAAQETPTGKAYLQESSTECRATLRQGRGSGAAHCSSINAETRARQHRGLKAGWKREHYPFIALLAMHGGILRKAEGE